MLGRMMFFGRACFLDQHVVVHRRHMHECVELRDGFVGCGDDRRAMRYGCALPMVERRMLAARQCRFVLHRRLEKCDETNRLLEIRSSSPGGEHRLLHDTRAGMREVGAKCLLGLRKQPIVFLAKNRLERAFVALPERVKVLNIRGRKHDGH